MENDEPIRLYDLETAIPVLVKWDDDDPRQPGVDFATGWDKYDQMKLAVLCAPTLADSLAMTSAELYERGRDHWTAENIALAQRPFDLADTLVSFNGISFDNNVLAAQSPVKISFADCYDILAEYKRVVGKCVKLTDLAQANGIEAKSGNGADAPLKWAQRQYREVIQYCFDDCRITALLYQRIQDRNGLIDPYRGTFVALPKVATVRQEGLF